MKLKKHVYRPGDRVWIIKPDMFVRCGYPLTFKMLKSEYEFHPRLSEALELLGLGQSCPSATSVVNYRDRERLGMVLAQLAVRKREFGGPQRRIYTRARDGCQDEITSVIGKLTVRTGDYYKPHTRTQEITIKGGRHKGEILQRRNDRGGLDNAKTHVILKTEAGWIEARNVVPAFYRELCGSAEGAERFRKAHFEVPENIPGVHAITEPKRVMEMENV